MTKENTKDVKSQTSDVKTSGVDKKIPSQKEVVEVSSVVNFAGNIEIYTDTPLPLYDSERNKAFRAVYTGKGSEDLFAIICERHFVPRRNAAPVYASMINPALVPLVAHGKVYWPPAKQERYVFLYANILGERFMSPEQSPALGLKQDSVLELVVKPMVNILQDFRDRDFFHGAIRPSNMFDGGARNQKFILGDCLSSQPSLFQSVLYEPIERAQADPSARGLGTLTDDLYAFGVSLAVMMRGNDPLHGMSDEEIIREKMVAGSYATVTGKDRFKGSVLELLRGLLHDDPLQRWTIDEVLVWLDGRRLSPKQALKRKKAARPFSFCGERFLQTDLLALSLDVLPNEVVKIVEDGSLEQWLARSMEDTKAVERLAEAYQSSYQSGRGAGYEDRIVANVSSVLDTMGPIRFRGLRIAGDGVGAAMYEAMVLKQDIKVFADMFIQSIAMNWVTATENPNLDVSALISKFDACRHFLRQNKIGFGIERCLYLLCQEAPCLSQKIKDYYVSSPEDLMFAFEAACEAGDMSPLLLDRHSAAFLSAKDAKIIDSYLYDLAAAEDYKNVMGNLKCLAMIQKRSKLPNFPHIAKVLNKGMPVIYKRFHDKNIRDKLKDNIERFVVVGDLTKMVAVLDNPEVYMNDFKGFRDAATEYASLRHEYEVLGRKLQNEKTFGRSTGKEFSALVSGALAMLIIVITTFMFLNDKNIF